MEQLNEAAMCGSLAFELPRPRKDDVTNGFSDVGFAKNVADGASACLNEGVSGQCPAPRTRPPLRSGIVSARPPQIGLARRHGLSHALHMGGALDSVAFETPGNGAEQ